MSKMEGTMKDLKRVGKEGRKNFDSYGDLDLRYVTKLVIPPLENVLKNLCLEIEKRHKIESEVEEKVDVIHYTGTDTLVSMLQQAANNGQNKAADKQNAEDEQESSKDDSKDGQNASLRLYDSVHFNDPDEGNYFFRKLNWPWLGDKKESHAYITSFIIPDPDPKRDMSDNLVFWRAYGREGEGCSLKLRIPRERLRKVLYGDEVERTREILQPVLGALDPLVSIDKQSVKEIIQKNLAEVIWKFLARLRYLYKSEAYEYEHECRFVIPELEADKDKICFEYQEQNNSPDVRHYYEHEDLKVEKILTSGSLITLGPCVSHPYNMSYYITSLLTKADLIGPEIKISEIAYRKP